MQVAVIGHVEWVRFVRVDRPPTPGSILHADEAWEEPAGGGGVAAVELARLAGACRLFTALGADLVGQKLPATLGAFGVEVRGATRSQPHRQALTLIDPQAERTIVVIGPCQAPSVRDGLGAADFEALDAVYFCKGDPAVLRCARKARVLVATARELATVRAAGVHLDALVRSQRDPDEAYVDGDLPVAPSLVVSTDGERGGSWTAAGSAGRWDAAALPGTASDAYGAGDCFAAGLTYALAQGLVIDRALHLAAQRGALALCRSGAHGREV